MIILFLLFSLLLALQFFPLSNMIRQWRHRSSSLSFVYHYCYVKNIYLRESRGKVHCRNYQPSWKFPFLVLCLVVFDEKICGWDCTCCERFSHKCFPWTDKSIFTFSRKSLLPQTGQSHSVIYQGWSHLKCGQRPNSCSLRLKLLWWSCFCLSEHRLVRIFQSLTDFVDFSGFLVETFEVSALERLLKEGFSTVVKKPSGLSEPCFALLRKMYVLNPLLKPVALNLLSSSYSVDSSLVLLFLVAPKFCPPENIFKRLITISLLA